MAEPKKPKWNNLSEMTDAEKVVFLMERSYKFLNRIKELEGIIAQLNCAPGLINKKLQDEAIESQAAYSAIKHKYDILCQQHKNAEKEIETLKDLVKKADDFIPGIIDNLRWKRVVKESFKQRS